MKRFLFVCSQNKLRSPTAEQIFSSRDDIEVSSAGTNHDAENTLDSEQVEWADVIVVMEKHHRDKVQQRFKSALKSKRVVVLDIADEFEFMEDALINILEAKMRQHLPS
ncbi:low molecular weight protein tyrosine phosphatase family protein [Sphingorhabdus sp.]|uniref:low molecular weight protein tyrosine phosphatase family protein n=1 Tax=Sphingorhabdus sp. TaxID=1902408 RepID=UPI003593CF99